MDAPEPDAPQSWLQRRGVDLAVWGLVILAMVGIAAAVAVFLADARFEIREITPLFEDAVDAAPPAPIDPLPTAVAPAPAVAGQSNPTWAVQPHGEFPARALWKGVDEGAVELACVVETSGRLSQCRIVSEIPSGYGFGESAIAGTRTARLTPRIIDGTAVPGQVNFTTRFRLEP